MIPITFFSWISVWKACAPCCCWEPSSSLSTAICAPVTPPSALISSKARWIPLFCWIH